MLLLCPKCHNCSYDHFNCSLFYNQVIFKGLWVFYPAPIRLSKSQTGLLFCSYAVNQKKSQDCPQYGNNSRFFFPCAYMCYKNTMRAGPSLSKVIVLIILMNKWSFNTGNKGSILANFQLWQHFR